MTTTLNLGQQPLRSFIPDGQNPVDVLADEPLETVKQKMAHGDGEAEYSMLPIRNPVDSSYSGYCVTFRGIYQAEGRSRDSATAGDAGVAIPSYSGDTQLEGAQRDLMQFVAVPIVDGNNHVIGIVSSGDVVAHIP